jgi:hypothetical protein
MNQQLAPNKFTWRTKLGVGLLVTAAISAGLMFNPILYIRTVAILTMFVAVAFPLVYMTLPWKETILGRALMTKARAVALLYVTSIVGFWWEYPFKGYVMALVTTYLAAGIGFQFIVLLRIKYQAQHSTPERTTNHESYR